MTDRMTPNPNPSPELKPCPFCGSAASIETEKLCHAIMCLNPDCGEVMTRWLMSVDEAASAWNTRALSQTLPAPGEVEESLYTQWLASGGCDDAPTITRDQHLLFQARLDRETHGRSDSWANTPEADHERILLIAEIELHLKSCRIFLTSREKMHPVGVDIHDELLAKVTAAIEAAGLEKARG